MKPKTRLPEEWRVAMLCWRAERRIRHLQRLISDTAKPKKRQAAVEKLEILLASNPVKERLSRKRPSSQSGWLLCKIEADRDRREQAELAWSVRKIYEKTLPVVREIQAELRLGDYPEGSPSFDEVDDAISKVRDARAVTKVLNPNWRDLLTTRMKPSMWLCKEIAAYLQDKWDSVYPSASTVFDWTHRRKHRF